MRLTTPTARSTSARPSTSPLAAEPLSSTLATATRSRDGRGSSRRAVIERRCTEPEALANISALLQLCQTGRLMCSTTTRRPSAATVRAVADVLVAGDFYPDDAIAAFAYPLLLQAGGLARLDGTRLALTPQGRKALGRP